MSHPLSTTTASGRVSGSPERAVAVGDMDGFVVGDALVKAVPQDLEPPVAERSQRAVMTLAFRPLPVVELPCPPRAR